MKKDLKRLLFIGLAMVALSACSKTEQRTPIESIKFANEAFANGDYKNAAVYAEETPDSISSQLMLAKIYLSGNGIEKNDSIAAAWYAKAAQNGIAEAQSELGKMYINAKGVARDYKEAAKWIKLAAEQNIAEAQYYMGWMYEEGVVFKKDKKSAVEWYRKAADGGNTAAMLKLPIKKKR
ncbi:MAG: tetratricopeptide repeat protein [Bacteroidales bacterium]